MSMTTNTSNGDRVAEMNVTPLIDVLLVLLIIFLLITPIKSTGLNALVPQPQAEPQSPAPSNDVVLQVLPPNALGRPVLKINQEEVSWENLQPRLRQIFAPAVNKVMFVKGDGELDFLAVAEAIDIARAAGVERVGLVTTNIEAGR